MDSTTHRPATPALLATAELVLRRPSELLARISAGDDALRALPLPLATLALGGFGLFGFLVGFSRDPLSGALAAPKLMAVGVGSLAICVPALHVYGRLLGNEGRALQSVCEALLALAVSGMTLLGLAPVWLAY